MEGKQNARPGVEGTGTGGGNDVATHSPPTYYSKAGGGGQDIFAAVKEAVTVTDAAAVELGVSV